MSSTTLSDGSYIKFQTNLLEQAPRPDELSKEMARYWRDNQAELKKVLSNVLLQKPVAKETVIPNWHEENGVIYFNVTTNGKTGQEWIDYFEAKGIRTGNWDRQILLSPDFKPASAGLIIEIAVLKDEQFSEGKGIIKNIRQEARERGFDTPNVEVACLIRDLFTDEDIRAMDLCWIITMHEPIENSSGNPHLLSTIRRGNGSWLHACFGMPEFSFFRGHGFAFVVSQVNLES